MKPMRSTETGWECDVCHEWMDDPHHTSPQPTCDHKWTGYHRLRMGAAPSSPVAVSIQVTEGL